MRTSALARSGRLAPERIPNLPETAYFELPPDWVGEVLSRSTTRLESVDKLPVYASDGFGHAWPNEPDARTSEVMALHEGRRAMLQASKNDDELRAPLRRQVPASTFSLVAL